MTLSERITEQARRAAAESRAARLGLTPADRQWSPFVRRAIARTLPAKVVSR
jgi:hypothetical protein